MKKPRHSLIFIGVQDLGYVKLLVAGRFARSGAFKRIGERPHRPGEEDEGTLVSYVSS